MTLVVIYYFFFFFSSRRRHTRSLCDWSSDVCSSDLRGSAPAARRRRARRRRVRPEPARSRQHSPFLQDADQRRDRIHTLTQRSEERRVGKECRSRRSTDHYKKKEEQQSMYINVVHKI